MLCGIMRDLMDPILFPVTQGTYVHSGHFMLFLGCLVGILLTIIEMKRIGERPEKIYPLFLLVLVSGICGARAFFCISSRETYRCSLVSFFEFWKGGMSLYGGAILAVTVFLLYARWQRLDFWRTGDMLAPSAAIFIFIARVGCFLAGCCYGRRCDLGFPLAVVFKDPAAVAPKNVPLYPTQPFFAASALVIFFLLWTRRRHKAFEGEISLLGACTFCGTSLVIECFRGDTLALHKILGMTVSPNQIVGLMILLFSTILYVHRSRTSRDQIRSSGGFGMAL